MSQDQARGIRDTDLEKVRARYGLLAVMLSNLGITGVAMFGVWQLNGDRAVIVGVLTSAFTAMASLTTAYLGIKAVSNTAQSMSQDADRRREDKAAATPPAQRTSQDASAPNKTQPTPSSPSGV
ncbi:hypothetical protein OG223_25505 [Streptomyces sp. NBC_01478]|uniref:hypothetical protein n=1 Tax=Streptomyces sp. NBC_01478 TaxID=2903882 RepID=UPI002E33623F|nr:hypothetical protein [Streptomyces sp. NBC_01478]